MLEKNLTSGTYHAYIHTSGTSIMTEACRTEKAERPAVWTNDSSSYVYIITWLACLRAKPTKLFSLQRPYLSHPTTCTKALILPPPFIAVQTTFWKLVWGCSHFHVCSALQLVQGSHTLYPQWKWVFTTEKAHFSRAMSSFYKDMFSEPLADR